MYGMNDNIVKQSLRLGISVLITCAIAQHLDRIDFVWYPVLAVIFWLMIKVRILYEQLDAEFSARSVGAWLSF
jgi:hypothetical protein